MGQMIEFAANGGTCAGYLALPDPDAANGRGVIVIQEWWGLVQHIKDVADRFAAEGYAALAPDLMHGEQTTSPDQAGRQMMALRADEAEQDLRGAIDALQARGGIAGKVGVVGFCMGGQLALLAATTSESQVGAAIDFYGIHPNVKPDFSRLSCPVLGFFGEKDDFVSPDKVDALAREIEDAGGEFDYTMYPDAGHAFFNDARPEAYEPGAAEDAWEQTLSFLADNLEGAERSGSAAHAGGEADDVQVVDDDDVEEEADVDDRHDREEAAGDDSDEREDADELGVTGEDEADERGVSDDEEGGGPSVSRDDDDDVAGDDEEVAASDDEVAASDDEDDDDDDDDDEDEDEVAAGPGDPAVASRGDDRDDDDDEDRDEDEGSPAAARSDESSDDDVEIVEADAEDDEEPAFGADEDESERRESNGAIRQVSPPARPEAAKRATPRNGSRKPAAAKAKPAKGRSFVKVPKPAVGKAAKGKAAAKPAGKGAAKSVAKGAAKSAAKGAAKSAARGAAKSAAKGPARGAKAAKAPARKPVAAARKGAAKAAAKPVKAAARKPNGAKAGKAAKAPAGRKAPAAKGRAATGKASKRR